MLTQHIALVSDCDAVSLAELARVSAALQRQVTRDLGPTWGLSATVDVFARLEEVPIGYWPVVVSGDPLGVDAGVHLDRDGQPYARVEASLAWSLDASAATLAMLVDPFGSRTALGSSPRGDRAAAEVLVEVCAPCASPSCAYVINDVIVSDFCTPAFFAATPEPQAVRYSWNGALQAPMTVLPGGHLSWHETDDDAWWVRSHHGENPIDTRLGEPHQGSSLRAMVCERAPRRPPLRRIPLALAAHLRTQREHAVYAATLRAERLRGRLLERQVSGPVLPAPEAGELGSQVVVDAVPETLADAVPETLVDAVPETLVALEPQTSAPRAASSRPSRAPSLPPALPGSLLPSLMESGPASTTPPMRFSAVGPRSGDVREPARARLWLAAVAALAVGGGLAFLLDSRASHVTARQVRVAVPVAPPVVEAHTAIQVPPAATEQTGGLHSGVTPPASMPIAATPAAPEEDRQRTRTAPLVRKSRPRTPSAPLRHVAVKPPPSSSAPPPPAPPATQAARLSVTPTTKTPGLAELLDTRE